MPGRNEPTERLGRSRRLVLWVVLSLVGSTANAVHAQPAGLPSAAAANVLVLWESVMHSPFSQAGRQGYEQALTAAARRPVTLYEETLDLERFPAP